MYNDADLSALNSASPTTLIYWHMPTSNIDGVTAISLDINVTFKFYCQFYNLAGLNAS